jgi:hypothetical protein
MTTLFKPEHIKDELKAEITWAFGLFFHKRNRVNPPLVTSIAKTFYQWERIMVGKTQLLELRWS